MLTQSEVQSKLKAKGTKFLTVTFVKKNGELRKINGRLNATSKIKGTGRSTPSHLVPIWSPREGWRSFDVNNVLEIR